MQNGRLCLLWSKESRGRQDTTRQSLAMKGGCSSRFCAKSSMRKRAEVDDITRKETFDMFWQQMDWGQLLSDVKL